MTTTKEECDQWNAIIAKVPHAEGADDLNAIFVELEKRCETTARKCPTSEYYSACEEICIKIERAVTQWENIIEEVVDGDDWDLPKEWDNNCAMCGLDNIFKKDDNTIIMWDDLNGYYIECSRATKEA